MPNETAEVADGITLGAGPKATGKRSNVTSKTKLPDNPPLSKMLTVSEESDLSSARSKSPSEKEIFIDDSPEDVYCIELKKIILTESVDPRKKFITLFNYRYGLFPQFDLTLEKRLKKPNLSAKNLMMLTQIQFNKYGGFFEIKR